MYKTLYSLHILLVTIKLCIIHERITRASGIILPNNGR